MNTEAARIAIPSRGQQTTKEKRTLSIAPMISRVHSLDQPIAIGEAMVFALEYYCAASDGESAARSEEEEEEGVVTANGCRVITRFPAEQLLVCGKTSVHGAELLGREASVV